MKNLHASPRGELLEVALLLVLHCPKDFRENLWTSSTDKLPSFSLSEKTSLVSLASLFSKAKSRPLCSHSSLSICSRSNNAKIDFYAFFSFFLTETFFIRIVETKIIHYAIFYKNSQKLFPKNHHFGEIEMQKVLFVIKCKRFRTTSEIVPLRVF